MEARALESTAVAPWAEVVPGHGPMTIADVLALPDDGWRYELVEGVLVPFAPDLAVEVASPLQERAAMNAKARRYLRGGARLVWIIYPHRQRVDVWRADPARPFAAVGVDDTLDGEDVAPGFRYPVRDLFR